MATKDTPTGLLARVANFVRSPVVDAPAQSIAVPAAQGELGKHAIKRMIERKAHNDAVRQREFSQLRKLREASPAALSEMAARASFYQDSSAFPEPEGRASTLKKIDEIEAQMSKQWWNGQQRELSESAPSVQTSVSVSATVLPVSAPASVTGLSRPCATTASSQLETCNTFAPTQPTHLDEPAQSASSKVSQGFDKARASTWSPAGFPGFEATDYNGFSNSNMVSVEMGQVSSDPVLEDAAIRFANSDDTGAESVLLLALKGQAATQQIQDTWTIALLDMYRSTGQQALYERLALDYAQRSERVASRQSSTLGPFGGSAAAGRVGHLPPAAAGYVEWQSPMVLDKASVELLQATMATGHTPARLEWQALKAITPDGAGKLAALMGQWCDQAVVLQFDNLEKLDILLRLNTTLGDKEVPQFWWHLRLNALRVLGSQEEFELVSMDYCMTYDISPPAWQRARCHRVFDLLTQEPAMSTGQSETTVAIPLTNPGAFVDANANCIELVGDVLGTLAPGLAPLQKALQAKGDLLVNCEKLVRVDFSAAGSILNWVASAQAVGKKIEFAQLPHLAAAFFNLIGINEHARVTARSN
jgi:hypothetical protein